MRNKKIIYGIVVGILVIIIIGISCLYMYWDYKNVIKVNAGYLHSDDSFMVVNTYGNNNSLWCRLTEKDFSCDGAVISSIDEYGYVQDIVTIKDAAIMESYYSDNHLYVLYYHVSDYYNRDEIAQTYRWADFDLNDLNNYTITKYLSGEIRGFDAKNAEPIKHSELKIHNELRSNVIDYNGKICYLDGKNLVAIRNGQYEILYTFDGKLNGADMYLTGDLLYVVLNDGYETNTIHTIDLQTLTHNTYYETAKEVWDCDVIGNTLYMLFDDSLMGISSSGAVTEILSLDSYSADEVFRKLLKDADGNIVLLSNQGFKVIAPAGNILSDTRYNNIITIEMVVDK